MMFLLVSKILLGYEEALWPKKLEISHAGQILTNNHHSYLITTLIHKGISGYL
jgi:hypothetical protein